MPLTLAQVQPLAQSKLDTMVIDEFRKSALIDRLPFDTNATANGGASFTYTYNRLTTEPTAAPRNLNADYVAQEALTTLITTQLGIMGGRYQVDRALIKNEKKVVDLVRFQTMQKAKATVAEFHDEFINGVAANLTGEFDGLDVFLAANPNQVIATGVDLDSSADITTNWRTLLDLFRAAKARLLRAPDLWLMNADMFAIWQSVMDRAGINLLSKAEYGYEVSQWGPSMVMALGDRPGTANPIIATAAGLTSIYGVCIGMDAVHGIAPEGSPIVQTYLPNFSNANPVQDGEVELIAGLAVKAVTSVVRLDNIDIA